jgi:hypothetical protein
MILDFSSGNDASKERLYFVAFYVNGRTYSYSCSALDHLHAVQLAAADHTKAGLPLPAYTAWLVAGQGRDAGCDCGGEMRLRTGWFVDRPETRAQRWTN